MSVSTRSFPLFNVAQFLGALTENTFKVVVIYFLSEMKGEASANILSLVGIVFVAPFLLFSSAAGVLADRFSKKNLIVAVKISEIAFMVLGTFFIIEESPIGLLITVFLMSTQSAVFGPAKYGIIPELVDESKLSKANGLVSALTSLAFVLSTFIASLILDLTSKNFSIEMFFLMFFAVVGFLASLGIKRTISQQSKRKINPFFLYEVYETLKISSKIPHLIISMVGVSFMLLLGTFIQLNIISFGVESLHLHIEGGGYLLLGISLGIVIGSLISGLISQDKIELGLSCVSCFMGAGCFVLLYVFQHSLPLASCALVFVGISAGGLITPCNTFMQAKSPIEIRGQIMGAAAFLAFVGMLLGAFLIFFFGSILKITPATGFFYMGLITLIMAGIMTWQCSSYFFSFIQRKILVHFNNLVISSPLLTEPTMLIFPSNSVWNLIPLFSFIPNLVVFIPSRLQWFGKVGDSIQIVPHQIDQCDRFTKLLQKYREGSISCFCPIGDQIFLEKVQTFSKMYPIRFVRMEKKQLPSKFLGFLWNKKQTHIEITESL